MSGARLRSMITYADGGDTERRLQIRNGRAKEISAKAKMAIR
jgi:hypothetical protein